MGMLQWFYVCSGFICLPPVIPSCAHRSIHIREFTYLPPCVTISFTALWIFAIGDGALTPLWSWCQ